MKTKITESELASRSAGLREKIAQLESQQTDEGIWDSIKSGWNSLTGGGQPAAAPAPAAAAAPAPAAAATPGTPAAGVAFNQGKPGEAPQAQAQAAAGPAGAPPKPAANAREQQYNTALKQIKDLYAKAKVQYPPQDDIVRQRYGLPPALPPLAQWDGKMPQSTGADFLTRNLFGRDGSKAVAGQQAANNISNTANAKSDAETEADVKQLTTLIDQLKASLASTQPVNNDSSSYTSAPKAAPGTPAAGVAFNQGKAPASGSPMRGGFPSAPATLAESIARLNKKMKLLEAGDPQAIMKQIQDLMTKINGNNEDPPEDVAQALSAAQKAIDDAKTATTAKQTAQNQAGHDAAVASGQGDDSKGLDAAIAAQQSGSGVTVGGPNPQSTIQANEIPPIASNGVNAQGQNVTITNADGSTTNPETGLTTPPANPMRGVNAQGQNVTITNADGSTTNPETGLTTPAPTAASIIGNSPVVQASQSAAAPKSKFGGYGQRTAESVSYRDDQALARIVELSRR